MATPKEYLARWKHNSDVADGMMGVDWEIVIRFYAATHIVEGYLVLMGSPTKRHHERIRELTKRNKRLGYMFADLKDLSEDVRYDPTFDARDKDCNIAREWCRKISKELLNEYNRTSDVLWR